MGKQRSRMKKINICSLILLGALCNENKCSKLFVKGNNEPTQDTCLIHRNDEDCQKSNDDFSGLVCVWCTCKSLHLNGLCVNSGVGKSGGDCICTVPPGYNHKEDEMIHSTTEFEIA